MQLSKAEKCRLKQIVHEWLVTQNVIRRIDAIEVDVTVTKGYSDKIKAILRWSAFKLDFGHSGQTTRIHGAFKQANIKTVKQLVDRGWNASNLPGLSHVSMRDIRDKLLSLGIELGPKWKRLDSECWEPTRTCAISTSSL